jgi:RNA polymerase sigma factor (sigma-70 family)
MERFLTYIVGTKFYYNIKSKVTVKGAIQITPAEYRKLSDEELVRRYAQRNENAAVNYLFDRYAHLILGICMKYSSNVNEAQVTINEIFLSLLDELKKRPTDHFKTWLFHFVKNYNVQKIATSIADAKNLDNSNIDTTLENRIDLNSEKTIAKLEQELKKLNKDERNCIEMFYVKKMNYEQIASTTGYEPVQVKQLLQNGKNQLKAKLGSRS